MMQKAKVTFDAMRQPRVGKEVLRTKPGQLGHVVKFGQRPHGFRCFQNHRFANGHARVRTRFKHNHRQALARQDGGERGATDAGTDNSYIINWR